MAAATQEPLDETLVPIEFYIYAKDDDGFLVQLEDWQCRNALGEQVSLKEIERGALIITGVLKAYEDAPIHKFGKPKRVVIKLLIVEFMYGFGAKNDINRGLWVRTANVVPPTVAGTNASGDIQFRWYKLGAPQAQYAPIVNQFVADAEVWLELQNIFSSADSEDPTFDEAAKELVKRGAIKSEQELLSQERAKFILHQMVQNGWGEGVFYEQYKKAMASSASSGRRKSSTRK